MRNPKTADVLDFLTRYRGRRLSSDRVTLQGRLVINDAPIRTQLKELCQDEAEVVSRESVPVNPTLSSDVLSLMRVVCIRVTVLSCTALEGLIQALHDDDGR